LLSIQVYQTYTGLKTQSFSLQRFWPLWVALALIVGSIFQQVEVWIILMRSLKISLPAKEARYGYLISFLARYIPGTIWGYISRSEWLWQNFQVSYAKSNYISLLEVTFAVLGSFLAIGLGIILTGYPIGIAWTGYLLILTPLIFWFFISSRFSLYLKKKLSFNPQIEVSSSNLSLREWVVILGLLLLNWFYYGLGLFLIGYAFGAWEIFQLPKVWLSLTMSFSLAWLIGFIIIFIPSGLGLREFVLSSLLASHFLLPVELAREISLTMRLTTTLAEVMCIVIVVLFKRYYQTSPPSKSPE
jgi:hypothetical protein